jgi:hypothetical protein
MSRLFRARKLLKRKLAHVAQESGIVRGSVEVTGEHTVEVLAEVTPLRRKRA